MAQFLVNDVLAPISYPLWAWYQWESIDRKRPDLRASGHLSKNDRGVKVEFECSETDVLLSDYILWHYVLGYWYLPSSMEEDEAFEKEIESKGMSYYEAKPLPDKEYHNKIQKSWEKIFDLDWYNPDYNSPLEKKPIQATFWQLNIDQVRDVKHFKSR